MPATTITCASDDPTPSVSHAAGAVTWATVPLPRRLHHGRQRPLGGRRGLPRTEGHTEGEENLARLVRIAVTRDIGWLTVFGFSTENWIRPRAEVRHILGLHAKLFGRVQELNELNVRIQWIGRPFDTPDARTPKYVQRAIRKAIARHRRRTPACCSPWPSTTAPARS